MPGKVDPGPAAPARALWRSFKRLLPNHLKDSLKGRLLWIRNTGWPRRWPRPSSREAPGQPGVNLFGYRERPLGLSEGASASARAIGAAGIPLVRIGFDEDDLEDGAGTVPAAAANPYAVNLCQVNALQSGMLLRTFGPEMFRGRFNIGYWAWEAPRLPASWAISFGYFNEIWTPSTFAQRAIARASPIPVTCVPHCVEVRPEERDWRERFALPSGRPLFLCMFDMGVPQQCVAWRKNPLAAIRAFRAACSGRPEPVLVVKVARSDRNPEMRSELGAALDGIGAVVVDRYLDREEAWGLISACDACISLHRAEGFGLVLAEAMALGKPVIATGYSGNMEFMTAENSLPVRCRMVRADRHMDPYPFPRDAEWAEPDIAHAAECIRAVVDDPDRLRAKGLRAARDMAERFSPLAVGRTIRARLEELGFGFEGRLAEDRA